MDPSVEQWFEEYQRLEAELRPFLNRIAAKRDGANWKSQPTEPEEVLDSLSYFYEAALVNNGDVFGYAGYVIEHKRAFELVGARGCLAALEQLMPFYEAQQKLTTFEQKGEYWHETRSARASAEGLAEEPLEFARLMLAYARKHSNEIGKSLR
jgi:hypothetical protein